MNNNPAVKKKLDYKWIALFLLWVAFFLQQGTRQIYGPLLGSIQASVGADMPRMTARPPSATASIRA